MQIKFVEGKSIYRKDQNQTGLVEWFWQWWRKGAAGRDWSGGGREQCVSGEA